jgi:hypothetical protein
MARADELPEGEEKARAVRRLFDTISAVTTW